MRKSIALWAVTALLSLLFLITGASKLGSVPPSPENFARWGLSLTFMRVIGTVEVLGAITLLMPKTAPFAALVLMATMLGALKTGIAFHEPLHIFLPLTLLVLLAVVVYSRRSRLTVFFARRSSPKT